MLHYAVLYYSIVKHNNISYIIRGLGQLEPREAARVEEAEPGRQALLYGMSYHCIV